LEDKEILSAIEKGDPERVMEILYKKEFPKLENYIRRNSGTSEDARDIFQEAVITLYTHVKLKKFNPQYQIAGFLYVVGCNRWKKRCRKNPDSVELDKTILPDAGEDSTYEQLFSDESKGIVNKLFEQVGENCRKILELSVFYDYSLREICNVLGYESEDTVKTRRYKCKQKMIALVNENPAYGAFIKENLRRS
jgi:RNA polymerase sigma factor (sigma-70 family)